MMSRRFAEYLIIAGCIAVLGAAVTLRRQAASAVATAVTVEIAGLPLPDSSATAAQQHQTMIEALRQTILAVPAADNYQPTAEVLARAAAEWPKNPFAAVAAAAAASDAATAPPEAATPAVPAGTAAAELAPVPDLVYSGFVTHDSRKVAIINNRPYRRDDQVGQSNWRLVEITPTTVVLKHTQLEQRVTFARRELAPAAGAIHTSTTAGNPNP